MTGAASDPPRVLIVAQNASADYGGEAFLPLKYFQLLRRRGVPVRMIAHARNHASLTAELGADMAAVDLVEDTLWHRAIWQAGRPFPGRIRDIVFGTLLNLVNEHFQRRLVRAAVARGGVDVIHQPIPVSPRLPSGLYGLGVPVVIGPMNGGMVYPEGYDTYESRGTRRFVGLTRGLARLANRLVPGKRRAALLLVANARTKAALPVDHPRVVELVENGVDLSVWQPPDVPDRSDDTAFRLVFMGRLTGWKAVDLTLEAVARARGLGQPVTLDILGDGEVRAALERQARDLGLGEAVRFHGFLPQRDCARVLAGSDALILNSLWECGGAVVLEAMALGLPVIASDWGGPADYLDDSCGILVHPVPRADFAERLATAIARLASDPALCRRMGAAGQQRIRDDFDWERKIDRMLDLYDTARGEGDGRR